MAEFCKDCARTVLKLSQGAFDHAILSKELDICEGCGRQKHVIERISSLPLPIIRRINKDRN